MVGPSTYLYVGTQSPSPTSIYFSPDGLNLYVYNGNNFLANYRIFTAWDSASIVYQTFPASRSLSAYTTSGSSISFTDDGYNLFITTNSSTILRLTLSTAWSLGSTLAQNSTFSLNTGISAGATHATISYDGYSIIATNNRRLSLSLIHI